MNIQFHLDEHLPAALASGLRRRGVDVTTTMEAGLRGASDREHIAFGLEQRRVIVTKDDDFLLLASEGARHAGIVFITQRTASFGDLMSGLLLIFELLDTADMIGHIEFL